MGLADELLERSWPHPGSQWARPVRWLGREGRDLLRKQAARARTLGVRAWTSHRKKNPADAVNADNS